MCKKIESIRKVLSDRRSHRDTEHPYDIAIILYPAGCVKGVFVARDSWFVSIISYGLVKKAVFAYTILKRLYLVFCYI